MFEAVKLRILQGDPIIHDVHHSTMPERYRGFPVIEKQTCPTGCSSCADICPAKAIDLNPLRIDLGRCTFCPLCEKACPEKMIHFSGNYHMAVSNRESLIITNAVQNIVPEQASKKIRSYFGKSLKLRQISTGSCGGCELELNAVNNVNFNIGRYGIDFVASPRHADGVVITGALSNNMSKAIELCYDAVPNPKIIILCGACAISGGIVSTSTQLQRDFIQNHQIDLFIPGCPPHPLTFICGLLDWLDNGKRNKSV